MQTLRINEVAGSSFGGEFSTPGKAKIAKASGTIQGDTLSLNARWERGAKCSWNARIDEQGVLGGRMQCARHNGEKDRHNPGGDASVSF